MDNMDISEADTKTELSEEEKSAAAFLRERFLFLIASLPASKSCKITMHSNTEVEAQIRAFDVHFENIIVENLNSKPAYLKPPPRAILRTSDIKTIFYEDI